MVLSNDITMNVDVRYVGDFPDCYTVIEAGTLNGCDFKVFYKGKKINNCRRIELTGMGPMFGDSFKYQTPEITLNWRKKIEGVNYGD